MNRFFELCILVGANLCCANHSGASIVFSDGDFNNADWTIQTLPFGNGGTSSSTQVATGGTPGSYRSMGTTVNPAPGPTARSGINLVHLFNTATYDPASQGAIASISYREDAIWLTGAAGSGMRTGPALCQGGPCNVPTNIFIAHLGEIVSGTETNWHAETGTWLVSDFHRFDPSDPVNGLNELSFPNFTNGGPITFGFYRRNNTEPGGTGNPALITVGIDNWQLTVDRVPEPASLGLTAIGAAALLLRRRRKQSGRRSFFIPAP